MPDFSVNVRRYTFASCLLSVSEPAQENTDRDLTAARPPACRATADHVRRQGHLLADPFSPEAFYTSAHDLAHRALEAHNAGDYRCVPLFAGTAIEHLAKACLAQRSPALLAEMRRDSNIRSLIALLRLESAEAPVTIRTVGLREDDQGGRAALAVGARSRG